MELNGYAAIALGLVSLIFIFPKFLQLVLFDQPQKKLNLPPAPPAWPLIGHLHLLGKLPHQSVARLAHKYGPLMFLRLGSVGTAVVSNKALATEFLKTHDLIFASRPRRLAGKILLYNSTDLGYAEYGAYWRHVRKICQLELLTAKRMEASKHIRIEEAYSMVKSVRDRCEGGKVVDVHSEIFGLSSSIIARMVLNKKYFASDSKEALEFREVVKKHFYLLGVINLGDFIPYIGWLDIQGYERQMKAVRKRMDSILDKIIQEHQEKKLNVSKADASVDFVDVLLSLESNGDYEHLSIDNIKAVVVDMLASATDTSAVTMEWALSEILLNPSVQQKAQQELDHVVGHERKVEEADLPQLKYLQSIVKETFRLHPAAPFLVPHESTQAVEVAGYDIPAKTHLLVNVWAIGRDPSTWERALEFYPERFLTSNIDVRGQDFELIPFGSGRRGCPGLSLGLATVQLGLAVLLQSYEWSLPSSQKLDMSEEFGLTLPKADPLHAIATPRLPPHLY